MPSRRRTSRKNLSNNLSEVIRRIRTLERRPVRTSLQRRVVTKSAIAPQTITSNEVAFGTPDVVPTGTTIAEHTATIDNPKDGDLVFSTTTGETLVYSGSTDTYIPVVDLAAGASAAAALVAALAAQTTADGKNKTYRTSVAPSVGLVEGDTWFDTGNGNKLYRWTSGVWVSVVDTTIAAAQSAATAAQTTADGKNRVFREGPTPTGTAVGDVWFNTSSDNAISRWNGSSWVVTTLGNNALASISANKITAGTIDASVITVSNLDAGNISTGYLAASRIAVASLNASVITSGTITATQIAAGTITATQISAGYVYVGTLVASQITAGTITGIAYNNGAGTFSVSAAGVLTATSANITGAINATSGTFAGSLSAATGTFAGDLSAAGGTFDGALVAATGTFSGALSAATGTFAGDVSAATGTFAGAITATSGTIGGLTIGASSISVGSVFSVNSAGALVATNATITGTIHAAAGGTIGGFTVGSNYIYSGSLSLYSSGDISGVSGATLSIGYASIAGGVLGSARLAVGGHASVEGDMTSLRLLCPGYPSTAASANVWMNATSGLLARSTSSLRYKVAVSPIDIPLSSILAMVPKSFKDKQTVEDGGTEEGAPKLIGLIAEEVALIPVLKDVLVSYDELGRPDAVNYDRIAVTLIPLIKNINDRLIALENL